MQIDFFKKNSISALKLAYNFLRSRPYPFVVVLRLTDKCNLKCNYCSLPEEKSEIPIETVLSHLQMVYKRGCRFLILTGGEPYLYAHKDMLLNWIKSKNIFLVINTNGTHAEDPLYLSFLEKADQILISLDGKPELNDKQKGQGTYEKVIRTLNFLKEKNKAVSLSTVVTKLNIKQDNLEHIKELKRKYNLHLNFALITERGSTNHKETSLKLRPNRNELESFDQLISHDPLLKKYISKKMLSPSNHQHIKCKSYQFAQYVNTDQKIYPCINALGRDDAVIATTSNPQIQTLNIQCERCDCPPLMALNNILNNPLNSYFDAKMIIKRFIRLK